MVYADWLVSKNYEVCADWFIEIMLNADWLVVVVIFEHLPM